MAVLLVDFKPIRGAIMTSSSLLKTLTLGFALTLSSNVFAASAQELLTEDMQVAIKSLPRETRLYHYFGINLNGNQLKDTTLRKANARYEMVNRQVEGAAYGFWNLNNHTTAYANAGLGLYLALDPYASSPAAAGDTGANFGSTMIEVTFNAGTRYLDLLKGIKLREETKAALKAEFKMDQATFAKLFEAREKGFWRDTLQYMAEESNTNFRKMVQRIFTEQSIAMTEYGWQAGTSGLCSTDGVRQIYSALVYVGGKNTANAIKSATMVYWNNADGVEFDAQEIEAKNRNAKLFSLLQTLRPLEKAFKNAVDTNDKATRKSSWNAVLSSIGSTYQNGNELADIRSKTFKCVK